MIYDCFTFFNELDLLEIRLNVLNEVVDKFVLVEMNKTFSGQNKPLYYQENKKRFSKFHNKIIHIIVDDCPLFNDCWMLESYQRNCIARGLKGCNPDDVIMISDLDEIPNPDLIKGLDCSNKIWLMEQKMYYYFVNYLDIKSPIWLTGTKILSYQNFLHGLDKVDVPYSIYLVESLNKGTTASKIRMWTGAEHIPSAGWHFSFLGGVDAIIKKIKSFSHQEFNKSEYTDKNLIIGKIAAGKDIFNRPDHTYKVIPLDRTFPKYILENQEKYKHLIFQITFGYKIKLFLQEAFRRFFKFLYYREKKHNGRRHIYVLGIKIWSYKRK